MSYFQDHYFEDPRALIDFFLWDAQFRNTDRFDATTVGKGGIIFRGQSDARWSLLPSAFRHGSLDDFTPQPPSGKLDSKNILSYLGYHLHAESRAVFLFMESADSISIQTPLDYSHASDGIEIINASRRNDQHYDYKEQFPTNSFLHATAFAQHYGVPTRLLDWSESPLVACYFAAIGASSILNKGTTSEQGMEEIAIFFLHTFELSKESSLVQLIKAPRRENPHLMKQQGVFTNIKYANQYLLDNIRWPTVDDLSGDALQLHRVRLPAKKADALLRVLYDLGITRHSLMPSLTHAAKAYAYAKGLFANGV